MNYMAKKLSKEANEFVVNELPTKEGGNKCFMVGADFALKDDLYRSDFWPNGVGFKRFDFDLYRRNYVRDKQDF